MINMEGVLRLLVKPRMVARIHHNKLESKTVEMRGGSYCELSHFLFRCLPFSYLHIHQEKLKFILC